MTQVVKFEAAWLVFVTFGSRKLSGDLQNLKQKESVEMISTFIVGILVFFVSLESQELLFCSFS